jgi:tetratricopeptide (TPR) repeat protein
MNNAKNINKALKAFEYDNLGKLDKAKELYLEILKEEPNNFEISKLLGIAEAKSKNFDRALECLNIALVNKKNDAYLLNSIANVYQEIGSHLMAIEYYEKSIEIKKNFYQAYINKGLAQKNIKDYKGALQSFNKAIEIEPKDIEAYISRGNLLSEIGNLDGALKDYEQAIKLSENYALPYFNYAVILKELRKNKEALTFFDRAIKLNVNYSEAYYNKALTLLSEGQYEKGFELYEWRWKNEDIKKQLGNVQFNKSLWLGKESLVNKTILIYSEQGLGDTLQFCRYAKLVAELGAIVILEVQKPLVNLLQNLDGVSQVVAKGTAIQEYDFRSPLMSMPLAFKTTIESIPNQIPYIHTSLERQARWKEYLGRTGFKIAICWQGNKQGKIDIGRSFSVNLFQDIAKIKGVRLISLQKNEGVEQLMKLPEGMKVETLPDNFDSAENTFLDSAAVINCMDLVITSDTAMTHLAGALGVKTWLPLKYVPDWRWMLDGSETPWYPNHRLFRQTTRNNWVGVFKQMEAELMTLVSLKLNKKYE